MFCRVNKPCVRAHGCKNFSIGWESFLILFQQLREGCFLSSLRNSGSCFTYIVGFVVPFISFSLTLSLQDWTQDELSFHSFSLFLSKLKPSSSLHGIAESSLEEEVCVANNFRLYWYTSNYFKNLYGFTTLSKIAAQPLNKKKPCYK